MARISLVEQYDNKDVIQQIYLLKTATDGWEERISATEQTANNALTTAEGFDMRIDAVEDANTALDTKVDGFDTRITTAQTTADTAIGNVDTLDRQVTARIADQEVTALDVASAGTGAYAVTAHKQNGNITSNSFNISKVVSATIGEGSANNSIYLQLNLSDGTTVRTNDTVISITGVEEDIHVTSIVLEDAPDAHTIKAIFTYNNGQSISSNTLTYDYPDIASSSMPGLVMGNDAAGGVQVDGQGRMSVVGWDDFATATELQDAVAAEKSLRETSEAEIRASVEAVEDELGAEGQAGTIRNEIALLKAKDTALQADINAVDASMDSVVTRVGALETDFMTLNDSTRSQIETLDGRVDGLGTSLGSLSDRVSTAESDIDSLDTRCDNISSTVSDHGTMLDAQAESIAENTSAITANASAISENTNAIALKQDKLTFDQVPTLDSQNPVTSGGVYTSLRELAAYFQVYSNEAVALENQSSPELSWFAFNSSDSSDKWFGEDYDRGVSFMFLQLPIGEIESVSTYEVPEKVIFNFSIDGSWYVHAGYPLGTKLTQDDVNKAFINVTLFTDKTTAIRNGFYMICTGSTGGYVGTGTDLWDPVTSPSGGQIVINKADTYRAGTGISIEDGVISINLANANGVSF